MRLALGLLCAAMLASCGEPVVRTQVMLVLDAEPGVRAETTRVHIRVRGGTGGAMQWQERLERTLTLGGGLVWPIEVSLMPLSDDASRVYEATATALGIGDTPVARVRAISGYRAQQLHATELWPLGWSAGCVHHGDAIRLDLIRSDDSAAWSHLRGSVRRVTIDGVAA